RQCALALPDPDRAKLGAVRQDDDPGLGGLFESLGRRAPVLLVLDDLHWAAAPTLSFLRTALDQNPEPPLLVVATSAAWMLDPDHPLEVADEELRARDNVCYLYLRELSDGEVGSLVRGIHPECDAHTLESIEREAEGNPKLAVAAIRGRIGEA